MTENSFKKTIGRTSGFNLLLRHYKSKLPSFKNRTRLEEIAGMIKTEIKKISNYKKELNITMDKADLEPIREAQAKRLQKEVQLPGFRKGKAPLGMIKRNYADAVEAYTLEAALDESLQKSVNPGRIA